MWVGFVLISICGAVSPSSIASSCEDVDASSLLQAKSLVRKQFSGVLAEVDSLHFPTDLESVCSEHRRTPGTCAFFGCYSWRGDTECVDGHCDCAPGKCSSAGVCVNPLTWVQTHPEWPQHGTDDTTDDTTGDTTDDTTDNTDVEEPLTSVLPFHINLRGSNFCSTESVSEADCLRAAQLLAPEGRAPQVLGAGHQRRTPAGCSVNGNWNVYFNRGQSEWQGGDLALVCTGPQDIRGDLNVHQEPFGTLECTGTSSVRLEDCMHAAQLLAPEGQGPGLPFRVIEVFLRRMPTGCSVNANWLVYFNTHGSQANGGAYAPLCNGA